MSKPKKSEKLKFVEHVKFKCPGCGADCTAGKSDIGEEMLLHKMPQCEYFMESDMLEFLTEARRKLRSS